MSFDSPLFLLLVVASMAIVRLPGGLAGWLLLLACAVFYSFAGLFDFGLFTAIIVVNWIAATRVRQSRAAFWIAVAANVGILAFFKYRELLLPAAMTQDFQRIAIPLGISFYLFHILAYLADLRAGRAQLVGLHKFALFIGFFPHLIAGPIVRAHQLMPQLKRLWDGTKVRHRLALFGLMLCLSGLVKKIVFSNSFAPVVDDYFYAIPANTLDAWAGAWLFGFQIYFDFSGYSDLALGSAMLMGLRLPTNFRTPYLSADPRDFWRRWHITLSSWIRDYLYIPLGGNREGGEGRRIGVLMTVMGLAGLWHGANLTFVAWGLLWGAYIALWRYGMTLLSGVPIYLRWFFHIWVVMILWVFFRSPDLSFALQYIARMFSFDFQDTSMQRVLLALCSAVLLVGLHWAESLTQTRRALYFMRRMNNPFAIGLMVGLCVLLFAFPNYDINPFIYFRF